MESLNWYMLFVAALVPMIIGFIWYNPAVFGKAWMSASGMTDEKVKGGNMTVIFLVSYIMSVLLAFALVGAVIHQFHIFSLFANYAPDVTEGQTEQLNGLMAQFATTNRGFGHGIMHGVITGITFATPILATNALFERKGFKYIAVNAGYWIVTIGLMGGILCQFM